MNICFFNQQEYSGATAVGGVERASFLLAKEFRRRGHRVEFFFSQKPRYFRIPSISAFPPHPSNRSESARFKQFLKDHKIDVAVWHEGAWHAPFSLKDLPCKLVTVWHGIPRFSEQVYAEGMIKKLNIRSRFTQWLIRSKPCRFLLWKYFETCRSRIFLYALRHGDKFILLFEEFFADFPLIKKFPTKVCAIPNIATYEAQNVSFDEKKKELIWVGRVEFHIKRPDYLLQIWQRLQDRFPDWSLRFVGHGSYLPELKKLSSSLGLKNVSFEGFQDPAPYYRSASIFCMTSMNESFGLVMVEAQAYGCVPVAFDSQGAFREIIEDGVSGILVPPFDLDAYAEKLTRLMDNPELRVRLGSAAQESVARFSPEAIGDKWEKLLREVVEADSPRQ